MSGRTHAPSTRPTVRRRVAVAGAVVAAMALPGAAGPAVASEGVRTETGLGGYRVSAIASPLKVEIDDPTIPIPRDIGAPILEVTPAYTATTLSTGPSGRATASSLWPGTLIGDGLGTATEGQFEDYPIKADARFPGGEPESVMELPTGGGMRASAKGLDMEAVATSATAPGEAAEAIAAGTASSRSTSRVDEDDVAVARAASELNGLSLLAGVITIDSVRTVVESRSDAKTASSTGTTSVSGLTIAGQGFVVDEEGVRPVEEGKPGGSLIPGLPRDAFDPLQALGITITPPVQVAEAEAAAASRNATGLVISIDTQVFREGLNSLPLGDLLGGVCGALPADFQGNCFYLLSATPKITYFIGQSQSSVTANPPIEFEPPSLLAAPPALPAGGGDTPFASGSGGGFDLPVDDGFAGDPLLAGGDTGDLGEPAVDDAVLAPVSASPRSPVEAFAGLGVGLVLMSLIASGLGAKGLLALQALALGGAVAGKGCAFGAPGTLPNLRGA